MCDPGAVWAKRANAYSLEQAKKYVKIGQTQVQTYSLGKRLAI